MITYKAKTASGEIINSALAAFTFPAGETHIKREERRDLEPIEIAILQLSSESMHDDLFHLAMWNNYIQIENMDLPKAERKSRVLVIPYMPGARADRGQPFGLDVYSNFLRSLDLDQIIVFDPHSGMTGDTLHAAAENVTFLYSHELFALTRMQIFLYRYTGIIAPDKGAVVRATAIANLAGLPVYTAEKTRDFETGKLTGFSLKGLPSDGHYLIVDDICDGGGTFLGLANAINIPKEQLDLYVSHGVFSKDALSLLPAAFDKIMTTNSFNPQRNLNAISLKEFGTAHFMRVDIIRFLLEHIQQC